jgi:hypothetical protein
MARIRTIKPEFFTDEKLAELSYPARIAFQGLWTQADKEGRLEDRPKFLKVQILPYDNEDFDALLQTLADGDFIKRYEVDGKRYIEIVNFVKHQRITGKEAQEPSKFPSASRIEPKQSPGNNGETPEKQLGDAGERQDAQERKGREGKGKEESAREEFSDVSPAVQCLNQLRVLACVQNCKNQDDAGQVLLLENLIGRVKLEFPPGEEWPYWAGWVASRASSKAVYTSATSSQTAAAVLERFLPDIQAEIKRRNANRQALGDDFGKPKDQERKLGRDYLIDPETGLEVPIMAGAL